MSLVVLLVVSLLVAAFLPTVLPPVVPRAGRLAVRVLAVLVALYCLIATSVVEVPADEVGLIRKIYGSHSLPEGRVIAAAGENGFQAGLLMPGFHFSPFINIINDVEKLPMVEVPSGAYGQIVTQDGRALPAGAIMADAWGDAAFEPMLDARYFMTHGGQKGLQASVLRPGRYPVNLYLYNVRIGLPDRVDVYDAHGLHAGPTGLLTTITKIPAGYVGVVRSTIAEPGLTCNETRATTEGEGLAAQLVPRGCKGVWSTPLPPGDYYLNRDAYEVIPMDTRVQQLTFRGGYARRSIDLSIDQKGDIIQTPHVIEVPTDEGQTSNSAVNTKVEGWEVPQELRVQVQVRPENAPIVVAAVGSLADIETRIIVPGIRSIVRNVAGGQITVPEPDASGQPHPVTRQVRVLDLLNNRPALEAEVLRLVEIDARRAGVDVKEIRYGEPVVPPELLVAIQREQLAGQLKLAFEQEQIAQAQRQQTEQARATADQQPELVAAQIAVQVAHQNEERRAADGRAERRYLEEVAAGQNAQAGVLGKESVLDLQKLKIVMETLAAHPEILRNFTLPSTVVFGGGGGSGGLEGPAAILGTLLGGRTPAAPTEHN